VSLRASPECANRLDGRYLNGGAEACLRGQWSALAATAGGLGGDYQLCSNSNCFGLAGSEGDDAPDRIVRRHADGHAISRNHLYAEAAHSAAELGEHFVAGVTLHAVKPAAVDCDYRALHVD